ncbi:MAG: DUF748 domain-containing protein [Sulfuricellaceae bacterium]|nr:DUF748 domain-containing protein [Sulfuricellaceae bacterium]
MRAKSDLMRVLKARRTLNWSLALAGLLLAFGLFGYFAGPPILKAVLLDQLSDNLNRDVSIERIEIQPYDLSAKVKGLSIKAKNGHEVAGFDELFVDLSSASIYHAGLVIHELRLSGPRLSVSRISDGRYDVSDLIDALLTKLAEPGPKARFSLNNIQLTGGKIDFDDQPEGKVHHVTDIRLKLPFVSSLPHYANIYVEPGFSAVFNGAPLSLEGRSRPFSENRESELRLDIDRLDLGGFQTYLPESLPVRLKSGLLNAELKVLFRDLPGEALSLSLEGAVHLADSVVTEADGKPLVGWKNMDVKLGQADLVNRRFRIDQVRLNGLDAALSVDARGEFNWFVVAEKLAGLAGGKQASQKTSRDQSAQWSLEALEVADGLVHWRDESNPVPVSGEVRDIRARVGRISSAMDKPIEVAEFAYALDLGERLKVPHLGVKGLRLDFRAHLIEVEEVSTSGGSAQLVRNPEGKFLWVSTPVLKTLKAAKEEFSDDRPWIARIGHLTGSEMALRFEDQATEPAAVQQIDELSLNVDQLDTGEDKQSAIAVSGRINQKGKLKVDGKLRFQPMAVDLRAEALAIPVLPLQPYFSKYLNILLTRGQVSSKGEISMQFNQGSLGGGYKGQVTLGDFHSVDKANSADFLKWKSLHLGGIDFRLQPLALDIREIALSDFYSRLIISPQGELNLMQIVKKPANGATVPVSASAASEPAPIFPVRVASVTMQGGTVNFSDLFIKPNYDAVLGKVGGRIVGLSTTAGTLADMELRGSYDDTAPVQVTARLNPLAAKSFLDLKADVTGVDLTGLSPYSGKYAGYHIEKGKLTLNVSYKVENGKLAAENRVFLDQLTFGDAVESPNATKLPVNLAIALLKNRRGEIELNLPISGTLDDPEFSVGSVVLKIIVNLISKAITAPFALLGSLAGGGEELSQVEFGAGRSTLDSESFKRLEKLAQALNDRPSLKLEITGRADPVADRDGYRKVVVENAVKAVKLKEQTAKGVDVGSLESIELTAEEYPRYLKQAYSDAKFPKPRNLVGMQKDLPVEEMEKLMQANLLVTDDDVRQLAEHRAEVVQVWLVDSGKVPPERVFLLKSKVEAVEKGAASVAAFSLK